MKYTTSFLLLNLFVFSLGFSQEVKLSPKSATSIKVKEKQNTVKGFLSDYWSYDWTDNFAKDEYDFAKDFSKEGVTVLDKDIVVFGRAGVYRFVHNIYWVNKESSIEKVNRIKLSKGSYDNLEYVKARVITESGKVIELDQNSFKEIKGEEGTRSYKIYSIPGVEKNAFVEILFKYKYSFWKNEFRVFVRGQFDIVKSEVIVQSYDPAKSMIKGYNGVKEVETSEVGVYGFYKYVIEDVKKEKDEPYTHDYEGIPRVDIVNNRKNWVAHSNRLDSYVFPLEITGKGAGYKKIIESAGAEGSKSPLEKIIAIERFIKNNVSLTKREGKEFEGPKKIARSRIANEKGIVRLYAEVFTKAKIPFEVYMSTDNDYIDLDPDFPTFLGLDPIIFYFPKQDVYMLPVNNYYYTGKLPNFMCGRKALEVMGKGEYDRLITLPADDRAYNYVSTMARAELKFDEAKVDLKKVYFGNDGIRKRGSLNYKDKEEKEKYIKEILLSDMENSTLESFELKNDAIELNAMCKDTLEIAGKITSEDILTPIPNGYILELPKLIGRQESLYEQSERQADIYVYRSVTYHHELRFLIPEGYKVEGLENFSFNNKCKMGDQFLGVFKSQGVVKGNELILSVEEFYNKGIYPKTHYPEFKKVVNSAYEFYISKARLVKVK